MAYRSVWYFEDNMLTTAYSITLTVLLSNLNDCHLSSYVLSGKALLWDASVKTPMLDTTLEKLLLDY